MQKPLENPWFRLIVGFGLVAIFLWVCYWLRGILIPLAFAFIVAYVFNPIVDYLQQHRIPRTLTITLLLILIFGSIAAALVVIIPEFVRETAQLAQVVQENLPRIQHELQTRFERYGGYPFTQTADRYLSSSLQLLQKNMPQILRWAEAIFAGVLAYTVNILGWIVNFLLFAVVSVYLLKDFHKILSRTEELIPVKYRGTTIDVIGKVNSKLRGFFRGQLLVCTILAVFYLIGLTLVGVPYAALLGLVGGYGQIIPYMGLVLAMFPAMLLSLIKYGDLLHPLLAGLVYVVGQMLEGSLITPRVMSGKVGLHPVVVILSILVFSKLLGFLGLLIAVPLTTVLLVLLQEGLDRYKKSGLHHPTPLDAFSGTRK